MNVRFIKTPEKREIVAELKEHFGIEEVPYLLLETSKDRIRGFSGSLSKDEIMQLGKIANIEIIGLYFAKKEQDWRISMDALHLLRNQASKNIIEIDDNQLALWLRGKDIETQSGISGIVILKYKGDLISCGKSNGEKVFNFVPKERRLRK